MAEWLTHEKPLALIRSTMRRMCFFPVSDTALFVGLSATNLTVRDIARNLSSEAMMKLADGDLAGAWQDAHCCHLLSRLVQNGPFLGDMLAAMGMEDWACATDAKIAHYGKLSAEMARGWKPISRL